MLLLNLFEQAALLVLLRLDPALGLLVILVGLVDPVLCVLRYRGLLDQHLLMLADHPHLTLVFIEDLGENQFIALELVFHFDESDGVSKGQLTLSCCACAQARAT